jgi:hypothetical protein|tara:strand:- start:82 stop:327 length:246 start_codon:yes stop_codon:yes gene_type:complete
MTTINRNQLVELIGKNSLKLAVSTDDKSIGFSKDGMVWFWYTLYDNKYGWEFDYRYNQANGSVIKTFNQQWKALGLLGLQG